MMKHRFEGIMEAIMERMDLYQALPMIVKMAVRRTCQVLEIEQPKIRISNEFTSNGGCYVHEYKELHISRSFAGLSHYFEFERMMEIICHELRHKFQYDTGMFSPDDEYITPEQGYEAYRSQPIEADAFEFGEYMRSVLAEVMLQSLEKIYGYVEQEEEIGHRRRGQQESEQSMEDYEEEMSSFYALEDSYEF